VRIIAGKLGGRNFTSPSGHKTHPMSDKVRGALFNTLGDITGLTVLDAFAGSGAIAFEAISRGAADVVAIDNDRRAQQTIADNINVLGLDNQIKLIRAAVGSWLNTSTDAFNIVIVDPPYDDIPKTALINLTERVQPGGLYVLSLPPNAEVRPSENFALLDEKKYGDAKLVFYRRIA
jgi:16S rRNA (guanine966-N2)-methyltransferase